MLIKNAEFITSSDSLEKCPQQNFAEYAFIGRSNVGKSSLINMLCGKKNLAHISNKPGKTKLINHYLITSVTAAFYFSDLPGYGYAGVSKQQKEKWEYLFSEYFTLRKNLICVFVLIDSRIPLQEIDSLFMRFIGENQIPFCIVFTKADKHCDISSHKSELLKWWEELPKIFITSSKTKRGKEELLKFIEETNESALQSR